ncbi:LamG-like jellyroll fold domain-containing protein [Galactobacter sp.]|uniref:LamG-like jellyroll fold domain-containing protein n=1 Tax=Galactobacter sp. TaxID=2676125 RepID=UPI0025C472F8|nr:LamG-like jellyroll fold domain-containing protein [Galactobacter sp.]
MKVQRSTRRSWPVVAALAVGLAGLPVSTAASAPADGAPAKPAAAKPAAVASSTGGSHAASGIVYAEPESSGGGTTAQGLQADYFTVDPDQDFALEELKTTVVEQQINSLNMVPTYQQRVGRTEQAGVRYTGKIAAPADGKYTFVATGDNGFRLWIDNKPVLDWWKDEWDKPQTSDPVTLSKGEHSIRFEQFQNDGGANNKLEWSGPGIERQVVPAQAFSLPEDYEGVGATVTLEGSGAKLNAAFEGPLSGQAGKGNVTLTVDGNDYPVSSAYTSGKTLVVKPKEPIYQGTTVRLAYNGQGSLKLRPAGGSREAVPSFDLPVTNGSTHRMSTPWASKVNKRSPLPEYPRPQLQRKAWQNLNGQWQLSTLDSGEPAPVGTSGEAYNEKITVPYPIESDLSGIGRHEDDFAYRREFTVPRSWKVGTGQRLKLNFGAVDYKAIVYVNGTEVASHTGGYDEFSADITDAVNGGKNELVVRVEDTTGNQPRGKQEANPSGIFYTPNSGIWQTVWMEPVAETSVSHLGLSTSKDRKQLLVDPEVEGAESAEVKVVVKDRGRVVGQGKGPSGEQLAIDIKNPHLWTPDDPHLYDLTVTTGKDTVSSYVGMRTIETGAAGPDGKQKILLNGKPTFLLSTLDQGYWPDGVYTAPTDKALAWDIEQTKDFGFNTIRKHIKVEPARWYYHADREGMLVWQDMPANNAGNDTEAVRKVFKDQLSSMAHQLSWSTSVIGWVPMNEGWGEWDRQATGQLADDLRDQDPSRLVNAHSGVNCCNSKGDSGRGDIIDWHMYTGPALPDPDKDRAAIDGEHGGFSLSVAGHTWPGGSVNPYGEVGSSEELTAAYVQNTAALVRPAGDQLSGSIYTQITDVEGEVNGLWTYDRRVQKMDKKQVRAANLDVIRAGTLEGSEHDPVGGKTGVAQWSLDEGKGVKAKDSTHFRNQLTLSETGTTWGEDHSTGEGHSLHLDGTGQATAAVKQLDTLGDYTVSAWVKLDKLPGKGTYATFAGADGKDGKSAFFLQYGNDADVNGFAFSFADGPRAVSDVTAETDRWYHLVGVRDAGNNRIRLYVNGHLADSAKAVSASPSTGLLTLGRAQWEGKGVDRLTGSLDQVGVWDKALSAKEVAALG